MVSYLAVLANPMLDLELAEVLASPMYGFTGDDLATLRAAGRRERLYQNLAEQNGGERQIRGFPAGLRPAAGQNAGAARC